MNKNVYIVGADYAISAMYASRGYSVVDNLKDAHIVQFTGGEDVTPALYGHAKHPTTYSNAVRDAREQEIWRQISGLDKLKVGICRGSQFLCVMNGGRLFQDVDNHAIGGTHPMFYHEVGRGGQVYYVTSTHHQMQDPSPLGPNALIWGSTVRSTYRDHHERLRNKITMKHSPDTEIVYYTRTGSLGFQPHPEYGVKECEDLFFICLERAEGHRIARLGAEEDWPVPEELGFDEDEDNDDQREPD